MWKVLIFIVLFEIILNFSTSDTIECIKNHPEIISKLVIHHIFNCFLLYGWLLDNSILLLVHVTTSISTIIYWLSNSNLCDLTVNVNDVCRWKKNAPFKDLLYMSGIKSIANWNSFWHYILVVGVASISVYKLTKK